MNTLTNSKASRRTADPRPASLSKSPSVEQAINPYSTGGSIPNSLASDLTHTNLDIVQSSSELDGDRLIAISQRAYQIAEQRGFAPGRELDDWLQAEREFHGEAMKARLAAG